MRRPTIACMDALHELLSRQHGVVNRRQVFAAGLGGPDLRRLLRRRDLIRVHTGVYVDRAGPPEWMQRAWAAVLAVEPAALWGPSALRAVQGPGLRGHDDRGPIHVAVDEPRTLNTPSRVVIHRIRSFEDRLQPDTSPPRVRVEDAVLDVTAAASDDHAAIVTLAGALAARLTTPGDVHSALQARSKLNRRRLVNDITGDLLTGSCAALVSEYLTRVEHAHGLPADDRTITGSCRGPGYLNVEYAGRFVVELDSRLDRTGLSDFRDNGTDVSTTDRPSLCLGWGQVAGRPCDAAIRIDKMLRALEIASAATPCAECRWRGVWAA